MDRIHTQPYTTATELRAAWEALKAAEPRLRIRDCAERLGVTEVQLLATRCGESAVRLSADTPQDFQAILRHTPELGTCMALTRNEYAVIEKVGVYPAPQFMGPNMGQFVDEIIDLRLFLSNWKSAFAAEEVMHGKLRRSIQFFDGAGNAIHKLYVDGELGNIDAYNQLVATFRATDQSTTQTVTPAPPAKPDLPDADIDTHAFLQQWAELKDTHDFFQLLKSHQVGRMQALRLAQGRFTQAIAPVAFRQALQQAAERQVPIMVFVGNDGCIEIHTGEIHKVVAVENWFNVMDKGFNLHVREDAIAYGWIVRKPTQDGDVTSIEFYDASHKLILMLFGKRKPGLPELDSWRAIVHHLPHST